MRRKKKQCKTEIYYYFSTTDTGPQLIGYGMLIVE